MVGLLDGQVDGRHLAPLEVGSHGRAVDEEGVRGRRAEAEDGTRADEERAEVEGPFALGGHPLAVGAHALLDRVDEDVGGNRGHGHATGALRESSRVLIRAKDYDVVAPSRAKRLHALEDALAVVEHRGGGVHGEVTVRHDLALRPLAVDRALGAVHERRLHQSEPEVVPVEVLLGGAAGGLGRGGHRGDAEGGALAAAWCGGDGDGGTGGRRSGCTNGSRGRDRGRGGRIESASFIRAPGFPPWDAAGALERRMGVGAGATRASVSIGAEPNVRGFDAREGGCGAIAYLAWGRRAAWSGAEIPRAPSGRRRPRGRQPPGWRRWPSLLSRACGEANGAAREERFRFVRRASERERCARRCQSVCGAPSPRRRGRNV